jgi:hypothetical protein
MAAAIFWPGNSVDYIKCWKQDGYGCARQSPGVIGWAGAAVRGGMRAPPGGIRAGVFDACGPLFASAAVGARCVASPAGRSTEDGHPLEWISWEL